MDTAFFWCGCQQAFKGEPPEFCAQHKDGVSHIVKKPKPKPKAKTKKKK